MIRWVATGAAVLAASCGAKTGLDNAGGTGSSGGPGSPAVLERTLGPYDADTGGNECLYFRMPRDFDVGAIEVVNLSRPVEIGAYLYRVEEPAGFEDGEVARGHPSCTSELPDPRRYHRLFVFGSHPDEASPGHRWELPAEVALPLSRGTMLAFRLFTVGRHDNDRTLVGQYALRLHERSPPVSGWLGFLFGSNRAEYERQRADCDICQVDLFARCDPPGEMSVFAAAAAVNRGEARIAVVDENGDRATPFYGNLDYIAWVETYDAGEVVVPAGGGLEYRCIAGLDESTFPLECAMEILYGPTPERFAPDISCVVP